MQTMVRPARRAFLEPGPPVRRPLGNGHFVACAAASRRLLRAPLAAPEQAPDARGTLGNAKMACNEGHNPLESPACVTPAMGARPLAEPHEQLAALGGVEFRLAARMAFGRKARFPLVRSRLPPATNRARRGFDLASDLANAPAGIEQGHRHTTTHFSLLFGAYGAHTHLIGTTSSFL